MRTIIWSNTFLKVFKRLVKKRPDRREEIEKTLRLLVDDPFNPKLETHKLKGKLSGTWACSVGYDLRIIFDFVNWKWRSYATGLLISLLWSPWLYP